MNRADRRRRVFTRSRLARGGTLASAGVLMSAGLFGAYTGSPRIQRAYASNPAPCQNAYLVATDDSLVAALNVPDETCIEIQGTITLNQALPRVEAALWINHLRESSGLTIFGDPSNGLDAIDGGGTQSGIRILLNNGQTPVTSDVLLSFSDLTLSNFGPSGGGAVYAYLAGQPHDLRVDFDGVLVSGNSAGGSGAALYAASYEYGVPMSSSTYVTVTDSSFTGNTSGLSGSTAGGGNGGALFIATRDDSAIVTVSNSTFTDNHVADGTAARGGAIAVHTWDANGNAVAIVGPGTTFDQNTVSGPSGNAHGGAIATSGYLQVNGTPSQPVVFTDDSASGFGGAIYTKSGASFTSARLYGNTAEFGGGVYNADGSLTLVGTTVSNNTALASAGGIYSYSATSEPVLIESSAVVGNNAQAGDGGGLYVSKSPLFLENSFIGGNSAGVRGGGIFMKDLNADVDLRFTTVYDDTVSVGGVATEIWARNITSTMSVVGNGTTGDIWEFPGTLDDSYSVSTADDTAFVGLGSGDESPGTLGLGQLNGAEPGTLGRTPNVSSMLATPGLGGFAPLMNPLPAVTHDQLGVLRVAPFTIGSRQAVVAATPSVSSVSPSTGTTTGGDSITIYGSGFTGATGATIGGTSILNFAVVDDTTITGTTPGGAAGTAAATVTGPGGTGSLPSAFTFVAPSPNPPAPAPSTLASPPREVRASARLESAAVAWLPPTSTGSFPVTSYQAVASPGGGTCMVAAPTLTCTITGLKPGTPYTVTARALTGAGWSEASTPRPVVVPLGPEMPTILITNSRDRAQKSMARVEGTTTGLVGAEVVPYLRVAGQTAFTPGTSTRTVDAEGNFVWQRKSKKRFTVYFTSGDVTSNRLVIRPE